MFKAPLYRRDCFDGGAGAREDRCFEAGQQGGSRFHARLGEDDDVAAACDHTRRLGDA